MVNRVTNVQKKEMLIDFLNKKSTKDIATHFGFSEQTIIRQLKKTLGIDEFNKVYKNDSSKIDYENNKKFKEKQEKNLSDFDPKDSFFEIPPLDQKIEDSSRKELSSIPISEVDFPKVVYMVVDKKIELEIKLLKDFPEWDFLPLDDLNRKTIEIFFDLNLAKRTCNKEQKVLKVPNTDVFRIASPVLIAKGISRIVCAENLIAL